MDFLLILLLGVLGAGLGSFAGASVWRLRARQLVFDKQRGETVDKAEYERLKPLTGQKMTDDRSRCLSCGYALRWYDLIPVVSWLSLRGKCRQCHHRIGKFELFMEIGMAVFFVLSYLLWPYDLSQALELARFIVWLIAGVGLGILFAYDAKWFLLDSSINYAVIALGFVSATLAVIGAPQAGPALLSLAGAILILSGLYYTLYLVSRERWVGFGDVVLGLGLALLLADWRLAFMALFAANLIGCFYVLPGLVRGTRKRSSQVPFGPLLIIGAVVAQLVGGTIIDWYLNILL